MTATTAAQIPAELKPADGRFGCGPSKVRPEALAQAGRAVALMGTSHRQAPVRDLVGRIRSGLGELFGLPDGYEVALGNGGTTAFWDAAAAWLVRDRSLHLTYGEFSQKFAKVDRGGAVPRRPDRGRGRARRRARAGRRPRRRRDRLGPQRDLDRGDGRRSSAPTGAGDALVLIDATSGAGGLPLDASQADAYYFAPQKAFGADGGLWLALLSPAAIARIEELDGAAGPLAARLPLAADGARELAQGPDLQHAGAGDPAAARRPGRVDARPAAASTGAWSAPRRSSGHLYGWAERSEFATPFVADPGQALAGRRHDRLRRLGRRRRAGRDAARQRHRRRRALPQAGPQPAAGRDVPGGRARPTSRR